MNYSPSFQLTANPAGHVGKAQRMALVLIGFGVLALLVATFGAGATQPILMLSVSMALLIGGGLLYIVKQYGGGIAGIKNNGITFSSSTARGSVGWMLAIVITGFYVLLYWFPETLEGLIRMMDPLSYTLRGQPSDQWFMYGTFYTLAIVVMGYRAILKYRHNRYQMIRTASVMFFQLFFAFLIPALLVMFQQKEFYFTYFWPLKYYYLFPSGYEEFAQGGGLAPFMIRWAAIMTFIGTPVLTYFFGKRWYCSWVCGCGGLAETAGDQWRQLSDKSLTAWKIERWMIHSVLVFITITTALLWINSASQGEVLGSVSQGFSSVYGFVIGALFSGVVGVGFYPIMGTRVWCRFGCPMAAVLGILQKKMSRFRITTNGGQCISCGNCSTYCEMGIDVRSYAQRGENIIRASCVGCGICAAVCPRGVLSLENGPTEGRYNGAQFVAVESIGIPPKQ
ncbi:MAG: 4Fe-4S binding protein [Armatimonadetes bacterium]|nr:4Fe-4S binding protein [Armatimonadota bacterium]